MRVVRFDFSPSPHCKLNMAADFNCKVDIAWSRPDLNCKLEIAVHGPAGRWITVVPAGPEQQAPDQSDPARTRTASPGSERTRTASRARTATPGPEQQALDRSKPRIKVVPAEPRSHWSLPDLNSKPRISGSRRTRTATPHQSGPHRPRTASSSSQ